MANFLLGRQARAYYWPTLLDGATNDAAAMIGDGTGLGSGCVVVNNIMDLTLETESELVDATTRGEASQGWRSEVAVLKGGRITFDARWLPTDAVFTAMVTAWQNGTEFTFAAMDNAHDAVNGTIVQGLAANFSVSFSKEEPLQDIQKISVTLSISSYPEWYKYTSAAT